MGDERGIDVLAPMMCGSWLTEAISSANVACTQLRNCTRAAALYTWKVLLSGMRFCRDNHASEIGGARCRS